VKKIKVILSLFLFANTFLLANPIDSTPVTNLSELVFDDNNDWKMELFWSFGYQSNYTDSIIIKTSIDEAKLISIFTDTTTTFISVISNVDLSHPLTLNRNGDTITIFTYSSIYSKQVREDIIIFGECSGASVGKPVQGFSIYRIGILNCLTKNPSLGIMNSPEGLSGIMQGHIYDINNKLITKLVQFGVIGYPYFVLETSLTIDTNGTYTTKIYNTIFRPGLIYVYASDFSEYNIALAIDSFELKDIQPDTIVIQDIHLKEVCNFCRYLDAIEMNNSINEKELTLINYPNPFNSTTNFFIKIPDRMKNESTSIDIVNTTGQLIKKLSVKNENNMIWDGKDLNGNIVASGIYYYSLNVANQVAKSGSMILLK
jgi:hypothetical protein